MRFFFDAVIFILLVPVLFVLAYQNGLLDGIVPDDAIPADPFIRAELAQTTSASDLSRRIDKALDAGSFDDATMYAEIADYMGVAIEPGTAARLQSEKSLTRTVSRNTGSFFEGFITGQGSDTAGFMGAITSDLTVVGDVRDIGQEGTKLVQGQDYSKLVLGLSVVGLAATTATVATGGGALPARIGVSLLKVAEKAGTVTVRFGRDMARILGEAVNFEKLKGVLKDVNLADTSATRHAVADYANGVSMARVTPVLSDVAALEKSVGPAESVRLLKYVDSEADLARITKMSGKLGTKTRGVVEITGKTSLRAFKTVANLVLWAMGWGWALAAAIGAGFLGTLGRRFRGRPARA
ncbi:MAG: hypothetical protein P4L72_08405 [Parvibaculum sp.]|uniref:hypothetical protein n=1 Tax=Parvibaculum sp. TaxID=2024848 RepID=UPI00284126EC|nr:hypothetical protein [Parvibaculum sp.]MDR3499233.1 hypothetical protein [Parvibaculum sp.]